MEGPGFSPARIRCSATGITMLALIDYGAGNLTSVRKAFAAIGAEIDTPAVPQDLARAAGIVVPGVGHFSATRALTERWRGAIADAVRAGIPLLGICLGMQWLFEGSSESPDVPGLGVLAGSCTRLGGSGGALKVPHVGWNALHRRGPSRLLEGVADGTYVYFTHAYAAPVTEASVAVTGYGETFASVVERGIVMGAQFHPEKSGEAGLRMLRNFTAIAHARRDPAGAAMERG
jgi:glutamine amidotransferase